MASWQIYALTILVVLRCYMASFFDDADWTIGEKRVVVFVNGFTNFQFTRSELGSMLVNVGTFFKRNSYGKLNMNFQILEFDASDADPCEVSDLWPKARAAAGFTARDFDVLLPCLNLHGNDPKCCSYQSSSWGYIGKGESDVWAATIHDMYIMSHELGHNLGLNHASEYNDHGNPDTKDGSLGTKAEQQIEYGDTHDRMGQEEVFQIQNDDWGLFNAAYTRRLRWIPDEAWLTIDSAMVTKTFRLFAFDQGFLPPSGNPVGVYVEMNEKNAAVLSYRYHGLHSEGRLEVHLLPTENLVIGGGWEHPKNLKDFDQTYLVDWPHTDPADVRLCTQIDNGARGRACQLGLSQASGPMAIPRSMVQRVTVHVIGSGVQQGKYAWIDVVVNRSGDGGPPCAADEYRAREANATHWGECEKHTICENTVTVSKAPYSLNIGQDCLAECPLIEKTLDEGGRYVQGASVACSYCGTRGRCVVTHAAKVTHDMAMDDFRGETRCVAGTATRQEQESVAPTATRDRQCASISQGNATSTTKVATSEGITTSTSPRIATSSMGATTTTSQGIANSTSTIANSSGSALRGSTQSTSAPKQSIAPPMSRITYSIIVACGLIGLV